jgi:hypothetical protein
LRARLTAPTVYIGTSMTDLARAEPESRALREVEAKRAILALHAPGAPWCDWSQDAVHGEFEAAGEIHCKTPLILAAVYADHPDYDESWRP